METTLKQPGDVIQGTKKYIINVARRFFSEYSYLGVSMDDIAKKLNITKAALYYHFTGKAEIYGKVLDGVFDDLSLIINQAVDQKTIEKKIHELIKNYLDFGCKEKNFIKALMVKLSPAESQITQHIYKLREQVADLIQPVIEEAFTNKILSEKVDSRMLTSLLTSMMDGLLLEYSFLNKKINPEKVSKQIVALIF